MQSQAPPRQAQPRLEKKMHAQIARRQTGRRVAHHRPRPPPRKQMRHQARPPQERVQQARLLPQRQIHPVDLVPVDSAHTAPRSKLRKGIGGHRGRN